MDKKHLDVDHDNVPAHASLLIYEFLMKHETTVVPQQPCSPDLAPAESILFPKLKSSLKGRQFQTVQEREQIRYGTFTPSSKTRSRTCSRTGNNVGSWEQCIKSGGEYFERDKFD